MNRRTIVNLEQFVVKEKEPWYNIYLINPEDKEHLNYQESTRPEIAFVVK